MSPALRATCSGLHSGAVFAGTVCLLVWAVFHDTAAAVVGGIAYAAGGVLALLAYPRAPARTMREIRARWLGALAYGTALIVAGALLLTTTSAPPAAPRAPPAPTSGVLEPRFRC